MEQSKAFQDVDALIYDLEQRLIICANFSKICEESAKKAEKEIEDEFTKCMSILNTRKEYLLKEIGKKVDAHSMYFVELLMLNFNKNN